MSTSARPPLAAPAPGIRSPLHILGGLLGGISRRLSVTLMLVMGFATACGLGALWILYDLEQDAAVIAQNERAMQKMTDSVVRGLESVMLLGSADHVDRYAERLKTVQGMADLRVLRTNGTEAFQDNRTVAAVNARLGAATFPGRESEQAVPVYPASSPHLKRAINQKRPAYYYETDEVGDRMMTVLQPLLNEQACQGCHGADHEVRGVLKVTTSIAAVDRAIEGTRYRTLGVVAAVLAGMLLLTYLLLRLVVVRRVARISDAMNAIVLGDYATRVPETDRDEIGEMARSFNRMAENLLAASAQLHEGQDMMTAVLRSAHEGIVVADRNGDVIMANAAAEQMLSKSSRQIVKDGLLHLFDNPGVMQAWRASLGDIAEEITYRAKPLQVYLSRIRGPGQRMLGTAVLLRDISGERHLREEVRRLHFTDEATGTGNSRYLEHALAHYWPRARASDASLAVMLISIDTLKDVTLSHGTQVAERIAKRVAQVLAETLGKSAPLARVAGDTFAAVLYGALAGNAGVLAQKVLETLHEAPLEGVQIWTSAGIAAAPARSDAGPADLVKAAGRALAQAIEAGGTCVRAAPAPEAA